MASISKQKSKAKSQLFEPVSALTERISIILQILSENNDIGPSNQNCPFESQELPEIRIGFYF